MDWFPWSMLQEEYALISCSFWEEALLLAHICFRTALLPAQSKPHPWEARRTSRRWRTRSSCSEIVAGTNKDHHSFNERHTAIWLSKISRFILDLLSHEYFLRIPQALAAPLAYIPLQRVSRTDTRLCLSSAATSLFQMLCSSSLSSNTAKSTIPHNHVAPPGCWHLSLSFNCILRSAIIRSFNDFRHLYKA